MSDKENKLIEDLEHRIDESIRKKIHDDSSHELFRDITKMQAPDKWPDPTENSEEVDDNV
jgi:hypothetical protein